MKYKVLIEETLSKMVEVEAEDYADAISQVRTMYMNEEIVLTDNEFTDVSFDVMP